MTEPPVAAAGGPAGGPESSVGAAGSPAGGLGAPAPDRIGRFDALRVAAFRKLFIGGMFTFLTMQMAGVSRAWMAFELTGTNTGLGGVMFTFGMASIFAIPAGGVLADRFDKRRILMAAGLMQTLTPLGLGAVVAAGVGAYWMLILASLIQGVVISVLAPARLAFMAEVVDDRTITNAVFLSTATLQITRVFGPALAGWMIGAALFGLAGAFFASAGLGALSLVLVVGLPEARSAASGRSSLGDMADGLRFVRSQPAIVHLLLFSFAVVLIGFPQQTFLPAVADLYGAGPAGFGFLNTAAAVGAVAVSVAFANAARDRLWSYQARSALAFGVSLVLFSLMPGFALLLAASVLVGGASSGFQALSNALVLTTAPVEYHGRVQSLLMLSYTGFAIASLPLGVVADRMGVRPTIASLGAAIVLAAAVSKAVEPRTRRTRAAPAP